MSDGVQMNTEFSAKVRTFIYLLISWNVSEVGRAQLDKDDITQSCAPIRIRFEFGLKIWAQYRGLLDLHCGATVA